MAKDPTDFHTLDFLPSAVANVACGQVLVDRHRHIAIVAKRGRSCAHLVQVKSGVLKMAKFSIGEIAGNWREADYPFDMAIGRIIEMGRRNGITDAARSALEALLRNGREPVQRTLFGAGANLANYT